MSANQKAFSPNAMSFSKYCTKNPQVTIPVIQEGTSTLKPITLTTQECLFSSQAQFYWCEKIHVCPPEKKVPCASQCKSDLAVALIPPPHL